MSVFSTPEQLDGMKKILSNFARMPFAQESIPGRLMETVISHIRGGTVLNTYDFVDVIHEQYSCGWQVKSTKASTPVTWKRAKIPNALQLISASYDSSDALQELGNSIIDFCNEHAQESIDKYDLNEIGYSRLIIHRDRRVTYFERLLCLEGKPIFNPNDFIWQWSEPKRTRGKEQLPALHGINIANEQKWWAWHGRGENQLHFTGESEWWPTDDDPHSFSFELPSEDRKVSFDQLAELLESLDS